MGGFTNVAGIVRRIRHKTDEPEQDCLVNVLQLPEELELRRVLKKFVCLESLSHIEVWQRECVTQKHSQPDTVEIELPRIQCRFGFTSLPGQKEHIRCYLKDAPESMHVMDEVPHECLKRFLEPLPHGLLLKSDSGGIHVLVPH